MIIAQRLRTENRAEYLLYMWQVEDIVRLYGADIDRICQEYLSRFKVDENETAAMRQWYADICNMMHSEGKMEGGHLQVNETVLDGLSDLHRRLLAAPQFHAYRAHYEQVLPYIVELRAKQAGKTTEQTDRNSELRPLFELLYGVMMLRMQQKPISDETARAARETADFLAILSQLWVKDRKSELEI